MKYFIVIVSGFAMFWAGMRFDRWRARRRERELAKLQDYYRRGDDAAGW